MVGWQWHQLDHMQIICTLLQIDKHTSFYRLDALPATQPTASKLAPHHSRKTAGIDVYEEIITVSLCILLAALYVTIVRYTAVTCK